MISNGNTGHFLTLVFTFGEQLSFTLVNSTRYRGDWGAIKEYESYKVGERLTEFLRSHLPAEKQNVPDFSSEQLIFTGVQQKHNRTQKEYNNCGFYTARFVLNLNILAQQKVPLNKAVEITAHALKNRRALFNEKDLQKCWGVTKKLCKMEGPDEDNETEGPYEDNEAYVIKQYYHYLEEREKAKKRAMEEMQRGAQ